MKASFILELLKLIMGLIPIVEELFAGEEKSGAQKKDTVIEIAKAVAGSVEDLSTGGQKETWGMVNNMLDPLIDLGVKIMNALGILKK